MSGRSSLLVSSLALLVGAAALAAPAFSTAAFTARTSNAASTVSAAADWTPSDRRDRRPRGRPARRGRASSDPA